MLLQVSLKIQNTCKVDKQIYVLKGQSLVNKLILKQWMERFQIRLVGFGWGFLEGEDLILAVLISSIFYKKFYLVAIERCSSA